MSLSPYTDTVKARSPLVPRMDLNEHLKKHAGPPLNAPEWAEGHEDHNISREEEGWYCATCASFLTGRFSQ